MINNYFPDECWPKRYMVHYNVIYYVMHAQYILIYLNVIFIKDRMYIFVMKSYPYQIIDVKRDEYYIDGYQVIVSYNCFSQLLCLLFLGMYKQVSMADSHGTFKGLYKSHVICFNLFLIQVSSYIRYLLHYTVYDVCSFENSYF